MANDNEVKRAMLKDLSNEDMLKYFIKLHNEFNPIDDDSCNTYELVKQIILERMEKKE